MLKPAALTLALCACAEPVNEQAIQDSGAYQNVEVTDIRQTPNGWAVETTDGETGEVGMVEIEDFAETD